MKKWEKQGANLLIVVIKMIINLKIHYKNNNFHHQTNMNLRKIILIKFLVKRTNIKTMKYK